MSARPLFVGTYSESLGHVDGKGEGVYAFLFDRENMRLDPFVPAAKLTTPQLGGSTGLINPTWLAEYENGTFLYICDEQHGDKPGSLAAVRVDRGKLEVINRITADDRDVGAAACCHASVTPGGAHVLAANYLSGSVVAVARRTDGSLNAPSAQYVHLPPASHPISFPGPNAARQEASHAHMAFVSAGTHGTTILVPDLGCDVVWSIPYDAKSATPLGEPVATASPPALRGGGPRHLVRHPTEPVVYVGYELSSVLAAYPIDKKTGAIAGDEPLCALNVLDGEAGAFMSGFDEDALSDIKTYQRVVKKYDRFLQAPIEGTSAWHVKEDGVPVCSDQETSIAAVRVTDSGSHVVVSSRLKEEAGALSCVALTPAGRFKATSEETVRITNTIGRTPRDFVLLAPPPSKKRSREPSRNSGVVALVANQDSGPPIVVLREGKEAEPLANAAAIPTPVCLCLA